MILNCASLGQVRSINLADKGHHNFVIKRYKHRIQIISFNLLSEKKTKVKKPTNTNVKSIYNQSLSQTSTYSRHS